jgi:hypothetical protein
MLGHPGARDQDIKRIGAALVLQDHFDQMECEKWNAIMTGDFYLLA